MTSLTAYPPVGGEKKTDYFTGPRDLPSVRSKCLVEVTWTTNSDSAVNYANILGVLCHLLNGRFDDLMSNLIFVIIYLQMYYTDGFPKSDLRQFIANDECVDGTIPVYEPQSCFPVLSRFMRRLGGGSRRDYDTIREDDDDERRPILA